MKKTIFAAALAALTLTSAAGASAQEWRGDGDNWRRHADINVRLSNGNSIHAERGDRLFYRLLDRPYNFRPGMTYEYSDRCNRQGCVVFVFDRAHRQPIDRIFAPHLQDRRYAWREARDFDRTYNRYGDYDRDDNRWNNQDERSYRDGRDGRDDQNWDRNDNNRGPGPGAQSNGGQRGGDRTGGPPSGGQRGDGTGLYGGQR